MWSTAAMLGMPAAGRPTVLLLRRALATAMAMLVMARLGQRGKREKRCYRG